MIFLCCVDEMVVGVVVVIFGVFEDEVCGLFDSYNVYFGVKVDLFVLFYEVDDLSCEGVGVY